MKFAILGAGAVGGYFRARLAEAGEDVTFMARHTWKRFSTGLRIESENVKHIFIQLKRRTIRLRWAPSTTCSLP